MGLFFVISGEVLSSLFMGDKEAEMQKNNPILINVPHSSIFIPNEEMMYFTCPDIQNELAVMTDHFCDDLFDVNAENVSTPSAICLSVIRICSLETES